MKANRIFGRVDSAAALSLTDETPATLLARSRTAPSWLNWVGIYFSKISRSVLRRIRVTSKGELRDRIQRYIEICNECPLVPKWP